jgi:hypothetical protein
MLEIPVIGDLDKQSTGGGGLANHPSQQVLGTRETSSQIKQGGYLLGCHLPPPLPQEQILSVVPHVFGICWKGQN